MSDGVTTNTTTCTNCNEQDTIKIAGKTFCANCGTPQPTIASGASTVPTSAAPSLSTDSHVSAAVPSERMPTVGATPVAASQSATTSAASDKPSVSPDTEIVQTRLKADQLHSALNTEQSPSIVKFAASTATTGTESDETASDKGPSEFSSLDDKSGESVMSDETLEELSKATDTPMPSDDSPAQAGVNVDVASAAVGSSDSAKSTSNSQTIAPAGVPGAIAGNSQASVSTAGPATEVPPAATPSITPPIENKPDLQADTAKQVAEQMPRPSHYKLDLSQGSPALPKAVSDVRPGSAPSVANSAAMAPQAAPTVAPIVTQAPVASPAPAPTPAPLSQPTPQAAPAPTVPLAPASVQPNPAGNPTPAVASVMANSASTAGAPAAASTPISPAAAPAKGLKASSVALSLVGLLLIGGYIWQVNYPNLALKVAGSKAGISANFPGYVPNGWKLSGNIQSSPGNISYNIANTKDNKSLQVSESKTDWDSQALAENYVAPKSSNYLALQAQGLTIYLYDGNQASWINNGTWYRIEGDAKGLSQDQVIKVATSL